MKEVTPKFFKWLNLKELRKLGCIELFFHFFETAAFHVGTFCSRYHVHITAQQNF